ncbi:baseplate J/gp47 family protein [Pantoea agglomerans]|uniref:baseplate J/gp47 family protein n=1 Tax=Enterobacter agglomerans TaxID=549 RepID=UPI003018BC70
MSSLNIKSFSELVNEQIIAIQARAVKLVDFSTGSILRSLAESNAGVASWLQQLVVRLLVTTRASTCSGEDLDSWMADFRFSRLSAVQATGMVTFSRFTATHPALILTGTKVRTMDGTQIYTVISDSRINTFDSGQKGYVLPAHDVSVEVPVRATRAGAAGNVLAGTVTVIVGTVAFVDAVTNGEAFTGGKNAETDDDFRERFTKWFKSLSKATKEAIEFALLHIQNGVSYTLTENISYDGHPQPGYFYAVVDDGSGKPSEAFIQRAYDAIEDTRGFTVSYGVFPPVVIRADVSMIIKTESPEHHAEVLGLVKRAVEEYINSLTLGQLLAYTKLINLAYAASPMVTNITSMRLNKETADLPATAKEVIRTGTIEVC